jgi:hypothetical protein
VAISLLNLIYAMSVISIITLFIQLFKGIGGVAIGGRVKLLNTSLF